MKRIVCAAIIALSAIAFSGVAAHAQGHLKPEIENAVRVDHKLMTPMRFARQEVWYNAYIDDPRYGKYKIGYLLQRYGKDKDGNLVFYEESNLQEVQFSVKMGESVIKYEIVIDPETGRTQSISFDSEISGRTYWLVSVKLPPESSIKTQKTASFDWASGMITVRYGDDPRAPIRTIPIESYSVPPQAQYFFMFKKRGHSEGKVYSFHYFDVYREKYDDIYLRYEGPRARGVHKYSTVAKGWGDEMLYYFWFGPPSKEAPNGRFDKILAVPQTTRYTTFLPVSKEEALKPVTPLIN